VAAGDRSVPALRPPRTTTTTKGVRRRLAAGGGRLSLFRRSKSCASKEERFIRQRSLRIPAIVITEIASS
jgi:hypothetical protein